jgi:exonuclease SbcC
MRVDVVKLKGFTTFREEAVLNLAALGPGLIAIAGPNGAGKSTLLEAIPGSIYRQAPSRGAVADLATSRESTIELIGENGSPFRALLSVDSHNGKSEAVLFDGAGDPVAGPKVRDFDRVIAEKFPPLSVYLAAAFSCQTGAGSLMKMNRADRRELFGSLLGLGHLEDMAGAARERARQAETELAGIRAALEAVKAGTADLGPLEAALERAKGNVKAEAAAVKEAEKARDTAKAELERLTAAQAEAARAEKAVLEAKQRAERLAQEVTKIQATLSGLDSILRDAPAIRELAGKISSIEAELEKNRAAGEAAAAEERKRSEEFSRTEGSLGAAERAHKEAVRAEMDSKARLADANRRLELAMKSTAAVPCAGALADETRAGCPALVGHFRTRDEAQKAITELETAGPALEEAIRKAKAKWEEANASWITASEVSGVARANVEKLRVEYRRLADELAKLKAHDRRSQLDRAEAEAKALQERLKAANVQVADSRAEVTAATLAVPFVDLTAIPKVKANLAESEEGLETVQLMAKDGQLQAARLEAQVEAAKAAEAKALELSSWISPRERDLADWRFLARGLGREGVQALELDAAGPRVSALANELLADAYGPRFQIRLDTQAAKADGKGVKETFDIVVIDNERGREGNGEDLSGGEKVIVGEALGLAVGLFHAQAAGVSLGTVVRDETVGALDPDNAERYLAMLRAFIRVGQVHQLLFVAHSPNLVDLADAIIRVEDGRITVEN